MKRVFLILFALLLFVPGCGRSGAESRPVMEEIADWPENAFTAQIPEIFAGTPGYTVSVGEESFSVFYRDLTLEEGEAYVAALLEAGYEVTEGAGTQNLLLRRGETALSVSFDEGILGVYIQMKAEG